MNYSKFILLFEEAIRHPNERLARDEREQNRETDSRVLVCVPTARVT